MAEKEKALVPFHQAAISFFEKKHDDELNAMGDAADEWASEVVVGFMVSKSIIPEPARPKVAEAIVARVADDDTTDEDILLAYARAIIAMEQKDLVPAITWKEGTKESDKKVDDLNTGTERLRWYIDQEA